MKHVALVSLLIASLLVYAPEAVAQAEFTCGWATENIVRSGATNENAAVYAKTYTVDAGVTVTTSTQSGIIICAAESITINGTLSVVGRGGVGGNLNSGGGAGLGSGGGGVVATCQALQQSGGIGGVGEGSIDILAMLLTGGYAATATDRVGAGGGGGRTGSSTSDCPGGGGGGGFVAGADGGQDAGLSIGTQGAGGTGGAGGGWIILIAPNVTIGSSGSITADGQDGADATASSNSGAGGGGAGGQIRIHTTNYDNQGSVTANGGDGGVGGGGVAGGLGGTPTNAPTTPAAPASGGGSGGGGAAGLVQVLQGSAAGAGAVDGFNSLLKSTAESPGGNCAAGGFLIEWGLDNGDGGGTERDGTLQSGEVDDSEYVCHGEDGATGATGPQGPAGNDGANGADGADGHNALVETTVEPPGVNCAAGGFFVEAGTDDGAGAGDPDDGILHDDEVDEAVYVCHGEDGAEGAQGPAGPQGAQGPAGPQGPEGPEGPPGDCEACEISGSQVDNLTCSNCTVGASGSTSFAGEFPGYTGPETAAIVIFFAIMLWALFRQVKFLSVAALIALLVMVLAPYIQTDWDFLAAFLLVVFAFWGEAYASGLRRRREERARNPAGS